MRAYYEARNQVLIGVVLTPSSAGIPRVKINSVVVIVLILVVVGKVVVAGCASQRITVISARVIPFTQRMSSAWWVVGTVILATGCQICSIRI